MAVVSGIYEVQFSLLDHNSTERVKRYGATTGSYYLRSLDVDGNQHRQGCGGSALDPTVYYLCCLVLPL